MKKHGFEGWYFKHQNNNDMISFIPGQAESEAFIQMISADGSGRFDIPSISENNDIVYAGDCIFSPYGCKIDLPGVKGEIIYGKIHPLAGDIMGPFRFFPMECRHGVISMMHALDGTLTIHGKQYCFDGGMGYIEKDSGISFPSSYLWLQCNNFTKPCSVMVSIAHIPFGCISFKGFICAVIYENHEYRFATYNGSRILADEPEHICLSRGKFLLALDIVPSHSGHPLHSPIRGRMSGTIHESINAHVHVRMWKGGKKIIDVSSDSAAYEFVPPSPDIYR